jgi:predicted nuclease of predicted toxin-antitoxin system
LVDENLPMLLVRQLIAAGHTALHARDVGLGHVDDTVVFAYAQQHDLSIITIDKGLSNILQYPPPHAGIVSVRLPEQVPIAERVRLILAGLNDVAAQGITTLANLIVIVMPGRVRVRHLP